MLSPMTRSCYRPAGIGGCSKRSTGPGKGSCGVYSMDSAPRLATASVISTRGVRGPRSPPPVGRGGDHLGPATAGRASLNWRFVTGQENRSLSVHHDGLNTGFSLRPLARPGNNTGLADRGPQSPRSGVRGLLPRWAAHRADWREPATCWIGIDRVATAWATSVSLWSWSRE
jgi:hypothetical protein